LSKSQLTGDLYDIRMWELALPDTI